MNYYITVSDDNRVLERIIFSYYDVAMYFVERRRKQGYTVTIKPIEA